MNHRDPAQRHRRRPPARPALRRRADGPAPAVPGDALALALQRREWERAALLLMLGVSAVARTLEDADIDKLLAMLDGDLDAGKEGP